jgi:hypothetical protein
MEIKMVKKDSEFYQKHILLRPWILIVAGLILITLGALIGRIIEGIDEKTLPGWWKYIISIFLPLIGATILSLVLPLVLSRQACIDCIVRHKVEDDRWCRWLGPISGVFARRDETILTHFFEGAHEIDILTPNLKEIVDKAKENLKNNRNAKVRMMSLHPECTAVYRRSNDMGTHVLDIKNRKEYSSFIRRALNDLQNEHRQHKLNWEIKTYRIYPVIMIFRADDRFLLGFPLRGNRVREQFHMDLRLPNLSLEAVNRIKERIQNAPISETNRLDPDIELGAEIRDDLMRHFNEIWENAEHSTPWLPRDQVFEKWLAAPLTKDCFQKFALENDAKLIDLIRFICSHSQFRMHLETHHPDSSEFREYMVEIVKKVANRTDIEDIKSQYKFDENLRDKILDNFSKIILNVLEASIEISNTGEDVDQNNALFIEKLIEKLSNGISGEQFEFEDLSEALFVLRNHIPKNEVWIWEELWKTIEKRAENWAR